MGLSRRWNSALPVALVLLLMIQPLTVTVLAEEGGGENENGEGGESENSIAVLSVLSTHENPDNGHTYALLEAANYSVSAYNADLLGAALVTIDGASENQWVVSTFTSLNATPRNLWIGLSDEDKEGYWSWDSRQPSWYRNWARDEPTMLAGEDYSIISAIHQGEVQIGQWMDSVEQPENLTVHGLVEIGQGMDHAILLPLPGEEEEGGPLAQAVIEEVDSLTLNDAITIEARVMPYSIDGSQFIMMKGDYGWGMHLTDGVLHYANDYAIRNHPSSEVELFKNEWVHLAITVEAGIGGTFWLDGQPAGNISAGDAVIPDGDLGSNECYQSGEDCDEFYLGRQGAGCD